MQHATDMLPLYAVFLIGLALLGNYLASTGHAGGISSLWNKAGARLTD
jgi:hypothetical protein